MSSPEKTILKLINQSKFINLGQYMYWGTYSDKEEFDKDNFAIKIFDNNYSNFNNLSFFYKIIKKLINDENINSFDYNTYYKNESSLFLKSLFTETGKFLNCSSSNNIEKCKFLRNRKLDQKCCVQENKDKIKSSLSLLIKIYNEEKIKEQLLKYDKNPNKDDDLVISHDDFLPSKDSHYDGDVSSQGGYKLSKFTGGKPIQLSKEICNDEDLLNDISIFIKNYINEDEIEKFRCLKKLIDRKKKIDTIIKLYELIKNTENTENEEKIIKFKDLLVKVNQQIDTFFNGINQLFIKKSTSKELNKLGKYIYKSINGENYDDNSEDKAEDKAKDDGAILHKTPNIKHETSSCYIASLLQAINGSEKLYKILISEIEQCNEEFQNNPVIKSFVTSLKKLKQKDKIQIEIHDFIDNVRRLIYKEDPHLDENQYFVNEQLVTKQEYEMTKNITNSYPGNFELDNQIVSEEEYKLSRKGKKNIVYSIKEQDSNELFSKIISLNKDKCPKDCNIFSLKFDLSQYLPDYTEGIDLQNLIDRNSKNLNVDPNQPFLILSRGISLDGNINLFTKKNRVIVINGGKFMLKSVICKTGGEGGGHYVTITSEGKFDDLKQKAEYDNKFMKDIEEKGNRLAVYYFFEKVEDQLSLQQSQDNFITIYDMEKYYGWDKEIEGSDEFNEILDEIIETILKKKNNFIYDDFWSDRNLKKWIMRALLKANDKKYASLLLDEPYDAKELREFLIKAKREDPNIKKLYLEERIKDSFIQLEQKRKEIRGESTNLIVPEDLLENLKEYIDESKKLNAEGQVMLSTFQKGGNLLNNKYFQKYLKYKNKYLELCKLKKNW